MATSQPSEELHAVAKELECIVCLEMLRNPRLLTCGHSFCLKCLSPMLGSCKSIKCPTCRRDTEVLNGIAELPKPYALMRVLQAMQELHMGPEEEEELTPGERDNTASSIQDTDTTGTTTAASPSTSPLTPSAPSEPVVLPSAPPVAEMPDDIEQLKAQARHSNPHGLCLEHLRPLRLYWGHIGHQKCVHCTLDRDNGVLWYSGSGSQVAQFIGPNKLSPDTSFEIEIVSYGEKGAISVGLVHPPYLDNAHPGGHDGSVGYHAIDGRFYHEGGDYEALNSDATVFDHGDSDHGDSDHGDSDHGDTVCHHGDIMRCTLSASDGQLYVSFHKNGVLVYTRCLGPPQAGRRWSPMVAMHSAGEAVRFLDTDVWTPRRFPGDQGQQTAAPGVSYGDPKPRGSHCVLNKGSRILKFVDKGHGKVAQFISSIPLAKGASFTIEILSLGLRGSVGLGLVPADYRENAMPGWHQGSVGYHAFNGGLYHDSCTPESTAVCTRGDQMSCALRVVGQRVEVVFYRNKCDVFHKVIGPMDGMWFPMVGMNSRGEGVKLLETQVWSQLKDYRAPVVKKKKTPRY